MVLIVNSAGRKWKKPIREERTGYNFALNIIQKTPEINGNYWVWFGKEGDKSLTGSNLRR